MTFPLSILYRQCVFYSIRVTLGRIGVARGRIGVTRAWRGRIGVISCGRIGVGRIGVLTLLTSSNKQQQQQNEGGGGVLARAHSSMSMTPQSFRSQAGMLLPRRKSEMHMFQGMYLCVILVMFCAYLQK